MQNLEETEKSLYKDLDDIRAKISEIEHTPGINVDEQKQYITTLIDTAKMTTKGAKLDLRKLSNKKDADDQLILDKATQERIKKSFGVISEQIKDAEKKLTKASQSARDELLAGGGVGVSDDRPVEEMTTVEVWSKTDQVQVSHPPSWRRTCSSHMRVGTWHKCVCASAYAYTSCAEVTAACGSE